ncbi:MAG: NADH-quinone oxidoreductase subunit C [Desulfobulbus propionicus]|nr:MAG: NADH-quinone oxidoreductase subunit C [Desulfobulbus propionicus]
MNVTESVKTAIEKVVPFAETVIPPPSVGVGEAKKSDQVIHTVGAKVVDFSKTGCCLDVLCTAEQIVQVAKILDSAQLFIESISGVDWIEEEQLEVVYTFSHFQEPDYRVMVRVRVPRVEPCIPTISAICPGADWHERETFDFYGITFSGHPNLTRILLPEDADFYPLRKDYMP